MWPTDNKLAGRIDVINHVALDQLGWQARLDYLLDYEILNRFLVDVRSVLGADNNGVNAHRLVSVVFNRDLALAVRAKPRNFAILACFGQTCDDAV